MDGNIVSLAGACAKVFGLDPETANYQQQIGGGALTFWTKDPQPMSLPIPLNGVGLSVISVTYHTNARALLGENAPADETDAVEVICGQLAGNKSPSSTKRALRLIFCPDSAGENLCLIQIAEGTSEKRRHTHFDPTENEACHLLENGCAIPRQVLVGTRAPRPRQSLSSEARAACKNIFSARHPEAPSR